MRGPTNSNNRSTNNEDPTNVLRSNGLDILAYYLVIFYVVYYSITTLFSFLPFPITCILLYVGYNKYGALIFSKDNFGLLFEKVSHFTQNFGVIAFDSYQKVRGMLENLNTSKSLLKRENSSRYSVKLSDDEVKALTYKFRDESVVYLKNYYQDNRLLSFLGSYASHVKYLCYEPEAKVLYHTSKEMCISFGARFKLTEPKEFVVKAIFNLGDGDYKLKFVKLQNESTWEELDL